MKAILKRVPGRKMKKEADKLSFYDHLDELRSRLIKSIAAVIIFSFGAYHYKDSIIAFITRPVEYLIFTSPSDAFVVQVGLSLFVGALLAAPVVLYQIWQFVLSALREEEKRFIYSFGPASLLLFLIGAVFAFYVVIPFSLRFLLSFSNDILVPMLSVRSYVSFVMMLVLAFGLIFEFPLIILFLAKIGIVTPAFLVQKRRYAIVLFFVVSAVITPPDLVSQFMMAVPLVILYEISIVVSRFFMKESFVYEN